MIAEPPYTQPIVTALKRAANVWLKWFESLQRTLKIAPTVLGTVSLSGQGASIAATSISTPATLAAGLYRLNVAHRVTRADGVSSSLTVFASVTESGIAVTYTGTANTSNALGTGKSETFIVLIDAKTAIQYGTTYVSGGGGPTMQYRLTIRLEQIPSPA
jgi:hypothetical protein